MITGTESVLMLFVNNWGMTRQMTIGREQNTLDREFPVLLCGWMMFLVQVGNHGWNIVIFLDGAFTIVTTQKMLELCVVSTIVNSYKCRLFYIQL
jgi:hypothetical protein